MDIIDLIGSKPKPWKPSAAAHKKHLEQVKKFPFSFTMYISYAGKGKTSESALKARNEIEKAWSKFGDWIGHGTDISYREHDVQVAFKNEQDVEKARKMAVNIMFKHEVGGRYNIANDQKNEMVAMKKVTKK